jgi:hypothetical protein
MEKTLGQIDIDSHVNPLQLTNVLEFVNDKLQKLLE